jgi:hypothetical protein
VRRQAGGGAAGYVLDEWRVCDDESLADFGVAVLLVPTPEFA